MPSNIACVNIVSEFLGKNCPIVESEGGSRSARSAANCPRVCPVLRQNGYERPLAGPAWSLRIHQGACFFFVCTKANSHSTEIGLRSIFVEGPDARLIGFMIDRLLADPSDRTTISEWARKVGMSERTPCRQSLGYERAASRVKQR